MPKKIDTIDDVKKAVKVDNFNEMTEKQSKKVYALMPDLETDLIKSIYQSFDSYSEPLKTFTNYIIESVEKYEKKNDDEAAAIKNICFSLLNELDKDSKRLFVSKKRKEKYVNQQIQVIKLLTELKKSDDKHKIELLKQILSALTAIVAILTPVKMPPIKK